MKYLRFLYRIFLFIALAVGFLIRSVLIDMFTKNPKEKRNKFIENAHYFANIVLKVFNIKIDQKGMYVESGINYIIVSNHLSYFDIVILISRLKAVFVSTKEVEKTFLFGNFAKYGGAIFIDRTTKNGILSEINILKEVLEDELNLVIFLEGTTSNGEDVLPFKSSFVDVIIKTKKPVLPVCIKYELLNHKPIVISNKDYVFYYGDMELFTHILSFLINVKSLEVSLTLLKPIYKTDHLHRKELAKILYEDIRTCYIGKAD